MRKSESAVSRCKTISTVQKLLGGKYKIELLWYIGKCDIRRFGQLRRQIGEITESSLTKQLRELETDGFILRHDFCEVPPRVEYTLTELGESFLSVLDHMKAWGDENLSIAMPEAGIKLGLAKGKYQISDDIDGANEEIAEMFGVNES